ncbi:MAG: cytochrome c family protein [Planctomycetota bacterium]|nr:cytochrome c family protein [Planctomycetota bacterium]
MNRWTPLAVLVTTLAIGAVLMTTTELPTSQAEDPKPEYVGVKACKACHFKQHKTFLKTKLAKSYEHLKPGVSAERKKASGLDVDKDYTKDPKCLKCHTTAYGEHSGFPALVEGKEWTKEEKARAELHAGVNCEACHGPHSLVIPHKKKHKDYKRADIVKLGAFAPTKPENCDHCHVKECPTMPEDYTFSFEETKMSDKLHAHKKLKKEH